MNAIIILVAIIALTIGPALKRLMDLSSIPVLVWPTIVGAIALPVWVAMSILEPGEAIDSADVSAVHDEVELTIPPDHSLMITATLDDDEDAMVHTKTSYALTLRGENTAGQRWLEKYEAEVLRDNEDSKDNPDINMIEGDAISESGRRRAGKFSEDLQERWDLEDSGTATILVTNYHGAAASSLALEVVPSPPPVSLLWLGAGLISLCGIVLEVKWGCDRLAGDVGFLACIAAILPQSGITPLDNIQGMAFGILGAALIGWGVVAGSAWLSMKYIHSKANAESADS